MTLDPRNDPVSGYSVGRRLYCHECGRSLHYALGDAGLDATAEWPQCCGQAMPSVVWIDRPADPDVPPRAA